MSNNSRMQSARQELDDKKKRREREGREAELAESKKQFGERLNALADLANEYAVKKGLEDPITELLITFLNVALEMQTVMETAQAVTSAMSCVTEAIAFLDTINQMDSDMLQGTVDTKYSFFSRLKQRRQYNRAIRNHRNRMKQFLGGLNAKLKMANDMIKAMKRFSGSLSKSFNKKNKKKGAGDTSNQARALAFMQERAKSQNINLNVSSTEGGTAPEAGEPKSGDYGDIFPNA